MPKPTATGQSRAKASKSPSDTTQSSVNRVDQIRKAQPSEERKDRHWFSTSPMTMQQWTNDSRTSINTKHRTNRKTDQQRQHQAYKQCRHGPRAIPSGLETHGKLGRERPSLLCSCLQKRPGTVGQIRIASRVTMQR